MPKYCFRDLVDVPALQNLTDDLYAVTGIPTAVIDTDGVVLTGSGWQRVCTDFHRKHPELERDCIESDTAIRQSIQEGEEYVVYECPRGLVDACAPVVIGGEHVANVFAGQLFLNPPGPEKEESFRRTALRFGLDEKEYLAAFREIPVMGKEKFRSAIHFLSLFAGLVANIGFARRRELEALERFIQVAEAASDMIWEVDARGLYTYVSPGVKELIGFAPDEIVGRKHFYDIHPEEGREEFKRGAFQNFAAKLPFKRLLNPIQTKSGALVWVETNGIPLLDEEGVLVGYRGVDSDVTAKIRREEEEERSRRRIETIIRTAMDGFLIADLEGRILQVNDTYCKMSGYTEAELLGMRILDLEVIESPEEVEERIQKIRSQGGDRFESSHRARDGNVFDVEMSVQYQPWDGGRCIAFIRDITERKKAEGALRERERRYRAIFSSSIDAVLLTDPTRGRIFEVNDAGCLLFGRPREEILRLDRGSLVDPGDHRLKLALEERDRTGKFKGELRLLRGDGSVFPAEVSTSVFLDDSGERRTAMIIRDVSERNALLEHYRLFEMLAENSRDIIIFLERDSGRILEANAAAVRAYGHTREELLGLTIRDLRAVETLPLTALQMAQAAEHGTIFETLHRRRDGTTFPVEVSSRGMLVGEVQTLISVIRDITERRKSEAERAQLQERLAHSQKMEAIGTLAGGIAHDFNNILGAIMGYTELSLTHAPYGSELRENLQDVLAASFRAKALVQQILAFGRRGEKKVAPVDATILVGEAMKLLVSVIPKTIAIEQELDPGAGRVMADPGELHQVVMNLCTNAYQAMPEAGGVLRVKVSRIAVDRPEESPVPSLAPGEYVRLEVADNGAGIDEKIQARIFEPYFTTKPHGKGTGLGLALVHSIVTSLGGAVNVKSAPGVGSVFTVYLPGREAAKAQIPKPPEALTARGKGSVLLVDDEPALARLGRKMLESLGYTVRDMTDPREALRLFESDPMAFDVIVTDQTMPGLTGANLLHRAREVRPGMPAVVCTGYSDLIDEMSAKEQGIGAFVQKPYDKNRLGAAVAAALGGGE